jgi:hypothetical protein
MQFPIAVEASSLDSPYYQVQNTAGQFLRRPFNQIVLSCSNYDSHDQIVAASLAISPRIHGPSQEKTGALPSLLKSETAFSPAGHIPFVAAIVS